MAMFVSLMFSLKLSSFFFFLLFAVLVGVISTRLSSRSPVCYSVSSNLLLVSSSIFLKFQLLYSSALIQFLLIFYLFVEVLNVFLHSSEFSE